MRKQLAVAILGCSAALALAQVAEPGNAGSRTETVTAPREAEGTGGPIAIEGETNAVSAYFFRGYRYIDSGYIVQPELTLSLNGPLKVGGLSATPYVTVWSNISELKSPSGSGSWGHLNEVDVIPGIELTWDKLPQWTLEIQYNANFFPTGIPASLQGLYGRSQEIGFTLALDDSEWTKELLPFALNPHISHFHELEDQSDDSRDAYLEFGIEPEFEITEKFSVSVPVVLGMSTDSYYVDDAGRNQRLGYTSIGLAPKYQLTEHWDVHASLEYLYLISDIVVAFNDGEHNVFIGSIGVGFSY